LESLCPLCTTSTIKYPVPIRNAETSTIVRITITFPAYGPLVGPTTLLNAGTLRLGLLVVTAVDDDDVVGSFAALGAVVVFSDDSELSVNGR